MSDAPESPESPPPTTPAEPRAIDDLSAAANTQLLARLGKWATNAPRSPRELPSVLRDIKQNLDPVKWRTGFLSVTDHERAQDVWDALNHQTPQALLRDLHRAERPIRPVERETLEIPSLGEVMHAREALRLAIEDRRRPTITPMLVYVSELVQWRRALLAEPWKPYLDDSEPRAQIVW